MSYIRWSKTAKHCYKIGCVCSKCQEVPIDMKRRCRMKFTVIELVKKYGSPLKRKSEIKD